MGKPHKHAELIKAWADGAEVQVRYPNLDNWSNEPDPVWADAMEYRIKPEPPKYPQTRMTEKERWDSITAAGIGLFNIGTSREKGADRLEHSPDDVTAAIANAAIARAIEDGDVVPVAILVKVAEAVRAELVAQVARYSTGCAAYINGETDLAAIIKRVKEGQ